MKKSPCGNLEKTDRIGTGSRCRLGTESACVQWLQTDAEVIFKFYEEGIQTGHAPFEAEVSDWHKWDSRHLTQCRWLAEEEDTVLGWGALTQGSPGKVYLGVAEVSIYVSLNAQNQDIGSILLERLISS